MPRRSGVPKRDVLPDAIYNSKVVTKLINQVMLDGEKGVAQKIVYGAFDTIKEKMNMNFSELLMNIRMKKAADLLKNTRFSIADISEMVGYTSVDYFTKAFKKTYQLTPSRYRKSS